MNIYEWIQYGQDRKWVDVACSTHDGIPMTEEEEASWWEGDEPCLHVLRLWPDADPDPDPDPDDVTQTNSKEK